MTIEVGGVCALLQVFDMPTSVHFYRDVLGFEIVETSPREGDQFDWGLLRLNDTFLMLNTAYEQEYRPAQPEPARVAAHSDTGLFFNCPDVDAAYRHRAWCRCERAKGRAIWDEAVVRARSGWLCVVFPIRRGSVINLEPQIGRRV